MSLNILKKELSVGEISLLDYFKIKLSERLLDILRLEVTYEALKFAKKIEFEILEKYEKIVEGYIEENFYLLANIQNNARFSALFGVFNNANCWIEAVVTVHECNPHSIKDSKDAEQGWLSVIYADFEQNLGMSREVAKCCLESLEQKGYIEKKRGIGAIKICANDLTPIINHLKSNSWVWFPAEYNSNTDSMCMSNQYEYMTTLAKEKYNFQEFFESQVTLMIEKLENTARKRLAKPESKIDITSS